MNYYQARQSVSKVAGDYVWHWTVKNNGFVDVAEPCTEQCTHGTQQEAVDHYYNSIVDALVIKRDNTHWRDCDQKDCAKHALHSIDPGQKYMMVATFCEEHLMVANWKLKYPRYSSGINISTSL